MVAYASGKKVLAECDVCGFRYKLAQLKALVRNDNVTDILACPECWNEPHPQERLSKYRIEDTLVVRNPRSDRAGYAQSRGITIPIPAATCIFYLEPVGVTIT